MNWDKNKLVAKVFAMVTRQALKNIVTVQVPSRLQITVQVPSRLQKLQQLGALPVCLSLALVQLLANCKSSEPKIIIEFRSIDNRKSFEPNIIPRGPSHLLKSESLPGPRTFLVSLVLELLLLVWVHNSFSYARPILTTVFQAQANDKSFYLMQLLWSARYFSAITKNHVK